MQVPKNLQENERTIVQLHLYLFSHVVQQSLREFCCVHRFDDPQQSWRRVLGLRQHPLHFALPCFIGEQHMHAHLLWTIYNRYVEIFSTPSSWFTNAGLYLSTFTLCLPGPFPRCASCGFFTNQVHFSKGPTAKFIDVIVT